MQWQKVDTDLGMYYTHRPYPRQHSGGLAAEGATGMRYFDSNCGDKKVAFGETTKDALRLYISATSVVLPLLGVLTLPLFYS